MMGQTDMELFSSIGQGGNVLTDMMKKYHRAVFSLALRFVPYDLQYGYAP